LRFRIALHHSHYVLDALQVLSDEKLSRAVAEMLSREVFVDDDVIIHEGEQGRGMYFIKDGAVDILTPVKLIENEAAVQRRGSTKDGRSTALDRLHTAKSTFDLHKAAIVANDDSESDAPDHVVANLGKRAFFGEMALLTHKGTAVSSVRVDGFCDTYHLTVDRYQKLLRLVPRFKQYVSMVAMLRVANYAVRWGRPEPTPSPTAFASCQAQVP
jgi:CRP-like cAMP-binding protein